MAINSRDKGARFEREVAQWFRDKLYDIDARRGQQFAGGTDSPDVILPNIPQLHIEAKMVERLNVYDAMDQATRDAGKKIPAVFMRKKNKEMLMVIKATDITRFASMWEFNVLTSAYYDRAIMSMTRGTDEQSISNR
jgi:hypothetical protein